MSILDILKEDHDKVKIIVKKAEELLSKYPKVNEQEEIELMKKLIKELEPHAKAEEKIFYKALLDKSDQSLNPYEGVEEHKLAMQLLKTLQKDNLDKNQRSAKIKVLTEMLLHHIREEESKYFTQAKKLFTEDELKTMGKKFLISKRKIMTKLIWTYENQGLCDEDSCF